jgi:hypothetical protein
MQMNWKFSKLETLVLAVFVLSVAAAFWAGWHYRGVRFPNFANQSIIGGPGLSDHDRTVALVQRWAKMGTTKPASSAELAALWAKSNASMAFFPDACQVLTSDVQTAFPERPGLAKGDLRVQDFNAPKNPGGKVKTVDDLAQLVLSSPPQ